MSASPPYREAPEPSRPCPRCGVELAFRALADVGLDECVTCNGVFVERDLLARVVDPLDLGGDILASFAKIQPAALTPGPMYVRCPRCRVLMNRRQFATSARIIVDICRDHGIWFDVGELRAVAELAATGGLERAARLDAERRAEEERARRVRVDAERRAERGRYDPADADTDWLHVLISLFKH